VLTEVYYPTTDAAVAGVPREIVSVLGVPITEIPAYRDVARADGRFPLVVFSHGNLGIRIQSLYFYGHLASHGYVDATPDHHGNSFVDTLAGIVDPPSATTVPATWASSSTDAARDGAGRPLGASMPIGSARRALVQRLHVVCAGIDPQGPAPTR
jgi:hypothetical protein